MTVTLSPRLEALIRDKVDRGLYASADGVVEVAIRLLDQRDRLIWPRAELAIGEEQERRDELIELTDDRFDEIKRQARENARNGKPIKDAVKPA